MPGKVADASVLGAMMFQEMRAEEAEALIGDDELYEPTLLSYELANIALKKVRVYGEPAEDVSELLALALHMEFRWVQVDHQEVFRLALETGLSSYNASYLHVARVVGVPLVTFDNALRKAISQ